MRHERRYRQLNNRTDNFEEDVYMKMQKEWRIVPG